jgi:hypothetical protein
MPPVCPEPDFQDDKNVIGAKTVPLLKMVPYSMAAPMRKPTVNLELSALGISACDSDTKISQNEKPWPKITRAELDFLADSNTKI